MLLADLVATSNAVAATSSRVAKRDRIAELLTCADGEVALAVDYLTARPRQRRTGVGWRSLDNLPAPSPTGSLSLADVDSAFDALAAVAGSGSQARRRQIIDDLFAAATAEEQAFLRALLFGELRQGALDGVMLDAIGVAADVPQSTVRRAAMLSGSTSRTAEVALGAGGAGLEEIGLTVGSPVLPMLAGSAANVAEAMTAIRGPSNAGPVVVDAKVDGVRVQIHRDGDEVHIFTRTLDDVTARMPEIVQAARSAEAGK